MRRNVALIVVAVYADAHSAGAQTPPTAQPVQPRAKGGDDIVVTSDRAAATTQIDRKVYVIGKDLQSVTGSVSDVLRDLPSVDVDADGNVSVRGDGNIQILIDGKPAPTTSSANRAEALQSLPASRFDRIEVINNPSARFKSEGSGGIINLITKRTTTSGWSGTLLASGGTDGRFNFGTTQNYNRGPLSATASFTLRRDVPNRELGEVRTQPDPAGGTTVILQPGNFKADRLSEILDVTIDYDLTPADRVSFIGDYNSRAGTVDFRTANQLIGGNGALLNDFTRRGDGHQREVYNIEEGKYRHSFAGKGHELSLVVERSESLENQRRRFVNNYSVPAQPAIGDQEAPRNDEVEYDVTLEYSRPLAHGAKLLLGYAFQRNDYDFRDRAVTFDPATNIEMPAPGLTNSLGYQQTIHSGYATLDARLAKRLAAVFGVRVEDTETDVVPVGARYRQHYTRINPSLHLERTLSDASSLQLGYSHRIVRPQPDDLNPYPFFNNPYNLRAGNPFLKPQETDGVDLGYHYGVRGLSIDVTPYYRRSTNVFSDVIQTIGPNTLLLTRANLGSNLATGSELAVNGKLGRTLTYSASANLYYNRIDAGNLGIPGGRGQVTFTGKANVDLRLTARDTLQVSVNYNGRRLVPQGFKLPNTGVNLGFRHQLRPGLSAVVTVTDVFDTLKDRLVVDTGDVHDVTLRRRNPRVANFALNWAFGGKKAAAAKFDYSPE